MRTKSALSFPICAVVLVVAALGASPVQAAEQTCAEKDGASVPASVKNPRELQANAKRANLSVALDGFESADGTVTLPVKDGRKVAKGPRDEAATAEIVDVPQRNQRDLDAEIDVSAVPGGGGTNVVVSACVTNSDAWQAGKFDGTIRVYGPRFTEFSYAMTVTQRWPYWLPLLILFMVLAAFGVFEARRAETGKRGTLLFLVIGIIGGGAAFLQYLSSDTWGDDWTKQIPALAGAAILAAAAARAAAKKAFG